MSKSAIERIGELPELDRDSVARIKETKKLKEVFKEFLEEFFETDEGKEFFSLLYLHLKDYKTEKEGVKK